MTPANLGHGIAQERESADQSQALDRETAVRLAKQFAQESPQGVPETLSAVQIFAVQLDAYSGLLRVALGMFKVDL